jgi:hypothetical protein
VNRAVLGWVKLTQVSRQLKKAEIQYRAKKSAEAEPKIKQKNSRWRKTKNIQH